MPWARAVRSTIGVLNIVRFGYQPALLSPEKLDAISALEARQNYSSIEDLSTFQPGSRVVVVDGPLAGMDGLVSAVVLGSDMKGLLFAAADRAH